jgi:NADPH:quinone reductase-like Zn-dependent oxidoreductase
LSALRRENSVSAPANESSAWPERTEHTAVAPEVKTEPMARIPDGVTNEQAAALPVAAITALRSLELLGVTPGQRLVVMGATGGVGGYTVQT